MFFLCGGNKNFRRANATAVAFDANEYPPDDWWKRKLARDSQTRTRLVDSVSRVRSKTMHSLELPHYAPVNVKPAGGGGVEEAGHGVGI